MSARLRSLVEDLRVLVPVATPGRTNYAIMQGDPNFEKIKEALAAIKDDAELDQLSPEELRALTTYKITVHRAGPMSPQTARKHIGATWRGAAKQAILKLSIGDEVQKAMGELMAGGIG